MALSGYFFVKIRFQLALLDSERLRFNNNWVKSNKHRTILSAIERGSMTLVSGNINYLNNK